MALAGTLPTVSALRPVTIALNASPALGAQILAVISGNNVVLTSYSVLGAAAITDVATYTVSVVGVA